MSHTNGFIFVDTTTTPHGGVTMDDIGEVLDEESRDLGSLCRSLNINPWSLNKPVRLASMDHSTGWQAGAAGDYGIVPHGFGTGSQALTALRTYSYDGGMNGWAYDTPRGYAYGEWYRQLDFDGYNHNSPAPWSGWTGTPSVMRGGNVWFGMDDVVRDWDDELQPSTPGSVYYDNIRLGLGSDTVSLGDSYFGVAVFNSGGGCVALATCANKMGASPSQYQPDANWSCGFDDISWAAGNYTAYPFFWATDTNQPMPSGWTSFQSGQVYSVPFTTPVAFRVLQEDDPSVAALYLTGACGPDPDYVSNSEYKIDFAPILGHNGTNTSFTLTRMRLTVTTPGNNFYTYDKSGLSVPIEGDNTWNLVDQPDGTEGIITDCDSYCIAAKIPGATYSVNVSLTLRSSGGADVPLSKTYEVQIN